MQTPRVISSQLSFLIDASLKSGKNQPVAFKTEDIVDWPGLVELSSWHQVSCLLYENLNGPLRSLLTDDLLLYLKEYSTSQAVFNMIFMKKAVGLNAHLQSSGVDAFLMKGPLWAWLLYENPGLREFGDIDFFVKKNQIQECLAVMLEYGFEPDRYREYLLSKDNVAEIYFSTDYQLPLTPVGNDLLRSLEVQWNTTYPRFHYSFTWDELAANRMSFTTPDGSILIPLIENQFLMMLIHHAGVEQWDKLKFMADFVRLLRKFSDRMDWAYIQSTSRKKGFHRLMLESLGMVLYFTGENYLRYCGDNLDKQYPSDQFLDAVLVHWENKREKPVTKSWQIFYYNMMYRDRLSDKLKILFSHLAYLLEWRLIIPKARWYRNYAKQASV